jgi:cystathionine gamma-synthase
VLYVGLETHQGHEILKQQARGFGAMISFEVDTKDTAIKLLENIKVARFAESLGGVETLITYPVLQTHADVPKEVRDRKGINDRLLRVSVGIESVNDLINDISQALEV